MVIKDDRDRAAESALNRAGSDQELSKLWQDGLAPDQLPAVGRLVQAYRPYVPAALESRLLALYDQPRERSVPRVEARHRLFVGYAAACAALLALLLWGGHARQERVHSRQLKDARAEQMLRALLEEDVFSGDVFDPRLSQLENL
jgi:hypothetical protein